MSDVAWAVLALLTLILALPFILLLKAVGEGLGVALSLLLVPLFHIAKPVRAACVVLLLSWLLWAHPLPFWLCVFAIAQVAIISAFIIFSADQYVSIQAYAVSLVLGNYSLYLCFLQSGHWTDRLPFRLVLTSLMLAAPSYFLRAIHRAYTVLEKDQEQRARDAFARRVDRRLRAGRSAPRFCLYLRGFAFDNLLGPPLPDWAVEGGRFTSGKPIMATDPSTVMDTLDRGTLNDLETVLAQSSRKLGGLIALGRPDEAIGAGRVEADEASWQDSVARLMEWATVIFVIPVDRPGTLWEIEHLVGKGYLTKTVFVLPMGILAAGPQSPRWNAPREKLRSVLTLPDYRREPGFYRCGPEGKYAFEPGHWDDARGWFSVHRTRLSLMRLLRERRARG